MAIPRRGPRLTLAFALLGAAFGVACIAGLPAPGSRPNAAEEAGAAQPDQPDQPTLRQAAARTGKLIGAAVDHASLARVPVYRQVLAREFDYLTPENAMKWGPIQPGRDQFHFDDADALVAFARAHDMKVKGHTLVWHRQLPAWVNDLDGPALHRELERHIRTVVGRYRGQILAWDVVNEAIEDDGSLRRTVFLDKLGPDYLADAFRIAHEADPTALLFYNDYSIEGAGKKPDAAYALVQRLLAAGVPVSGVGLQMHIRARGDATPAEIGRNMDRLIALGLLVNVSEMDVRVRELSGPRKARLEVQRQTYHDVVSACLQRPRCHAVTFWGFTDAVSWVDDFFGADDPLPFDERYRRKPAYFGIRAALLGQ